MSVHSEQKNCDMHLHTEMDVLKEALIEKQNQLIAMETACLRESDRQVELEDSIIAWQDKYDRLYESHKRVQKINQSLEDKLLKLVDRNSNERAQLTSDVATLSVRLAQANYNIGKLQREIERYKNDINLAIQLLQCKPESFVPQKVSSLPMDMQSKVSSYMRLETASHSDSEDNTSGVGVATSSSYKVLPASDSPPPVCPFPPTAMVYSMRGVDAPNSDLPNIKNNITNNNNSSGDQMVSPAIIAKYLEDELKANEIKHCDTCQCSTKDLTVLADEPKTYTVSTQTIHFGGDGNSSLCLRCNSNLNSPSRTNSPFIMKLLKSSDSVISETKSSVSDINDGDHKLFIPNKKDDLMVNPILGHHRLCDRTANKIQQAQQQQQHLNDTAKYFLENHRKMEKISTSTSSDLIDLRKFTEKAGISGMMTGTGEFVLSTRSTAATANDKIDSSRKCDEGTVNVSGGKIVKDSIQGKNKSDNLGADKKIEQVCNGGKIGNLQNVTSGSVTSLWSKNSDGEGAKIFETFNRNLIKTIKSDNPKHRGPRLCAMRIQSNGASNILLDNIETEVTPVVYTRRQRFLDEELDDSKDIITSKSTLKLGAAIMNSPLKSPSPIISKNFQNQSADTTIDIEDDHIKIGNCNVADQSQLQGQIQQLGTQTDHDRKYLTTANPNGVCKFNNSIPSHLEDQFNRLKMLNNDEQQQHQFSHTNNPSYEMLTLNSGAGELFNNGMIGNSSCKNSKTTCTQSSSISEIDLQETALLRRQQLNRVAEWVQNNSKIEIEQQKAQAKQLQQKQNTILHNNLSYNNCMNGLDNCCTNNHVNTQSDNSLNVDQSPNSLEKVSIDSGYKTTNKDQQMYGVVGTGSNTKDLNKYSNHNGYIRTALVSDDHIINKTSFYSTKPDTTGNVVVAQNKLILKNQQYFSQQNDQYTSNSHTVDLAQMEYNVKQFLLKQNEWSIQNLNNNINSKSGSSSNLSSGETTNDVANITDEIIEINSGIIHTTPDLIASNKFYPNIESRQIFTKTCNPHRTETNL